MYKKSHVMVHDLESQSMCHFLSVTTLLFCTVFEITTFTEIIQSQQDSRKLHTIYVFWFRKYEYQKGFEHLKWPQMSPKIIGIGAIRYATYDFLLVCHWHSVSILHCFRDIITNFPKSKEVTWPFWGHVTSHTLLGTIYHTYTSTHQDQSVQQIWTV